MKHAPQLIIGFVLMLFFSLIVLLLVVTDAAAQFDYNKFIAPSPTASSLGKYGDVPISLYTGTPNINVPLGSLTGTELDLPISLSYMAHGVKIEENASWVGTGWSLSAGGVITCTIRGHEDASGKPRPTFPMPLAAVDKSTILLNVQENFYDPEPDLFFFNLPGHSGSFVLNHDGSAVLDDAKDIRIVRDAENKYKFTITIENGTQYIFDKIENTGYAGASTSSGVAAIYLSRIISPTGKEVVDFTYAGELTKFYSLSRPVKRIRPTNTVVEAYPARFGITTISSLRLTDIKTNFGGNIQFIPDDSPRADLGAVDPSIAPRALRKMNYYDRDGIVKRRVEFTYEMIRTTRTYSQLRGTDPAVDENTAYANNRLYLKSVNEVSGDGELEKPPHVFTYAGRNERNEDFLPNKLSPAQDHWGYYNGSSNQDLWPGYSGPFGTYDSNFNAHAADGCATTIGGQASLTVQGADRRPHFPESMYGTLTDIIYPTGAHTNFLFEPHRYAYESSKGGYSVTTAEAIAQLYIAAASDVLTKEVVVNANLAATITVEFAATCWDPNTLTSNYKCDAKGAQPDAVLFQDNSVTLTDITGHEIAAVKWIPGDGGFHVYRDGFIVGSAIMPDGEGNIKADITDLNLVYGTYTFKLIKDRDSPTDIYAWFHYPSETTIDVSNTAVHNVSGGLRIKKIETYDENGESANVRTYDYGLGVLIDGPKYSTYVFSQGSFFQSCDSYSYDNTGAYLEVSSGSHTSLGQTQGSPIGYETVTENFTGNGSITYDYTTGIDYPDNSETESNGITYVFGRTSGIASQESYSFPGRSAWPFINQDNVDRKRGFLKKVTYKDNAGAVVMIKENIPIMNDRKVVYGLRMQTLRANTDWLYSVYKYSSGTVNIARNIETQIQQTPHNELTRIVDFFFEGQNHGQVTKQIAIGSRGDTATTKFRYPDDYTAITDLNNPIAQMKSTSLHMIGYPIETKKYLNGKVTGGDIRVPGLFGRSAGGFFVAPKTEFKIMEQISNPATEWSADPVNPDLTTFFSNGSLDYDGNANVTLMLPRDQVPIVLLWETEIPSPIAKVIGAERGAAYFSGFELSGISDGPAHTGRKYRDNGNFDFKVDGNFSPPDPASLRMSYWYWKSNQWIFSGVVPFTNSIASGGSRLDDVRAFPDGSLMTTYTYEPLVGITSQTDPNNFTTFYRYDSLGRLAVTVDNDGNILKKYTYHLNGQ